MARLDLVVFGATGFTGKYTVEELMKMSDIKGPFTWGIAGRNAGKLKDLLARIGRNYERDLSGIPVIVADISDEESLKEMALKAKIILNCCGPYRFYGEAVVKACIASKTHHVDVSGEPQYMEQMQLKYHEAAQKKGVYIVSACGFDSIPADLGLVFLAKEFKGQVNGVETYLETWSTSSEKSAALHYGTWESAVHGLANSGELSALRRKLYPNKLPAFSPRMPARAPVHKSDVVNKWCLPFPGADRSVMQRTQRWFFDNKKQRPIQVHAYAAMPNFLAMVFTVSLGLVFRFLTQYQWGRHLLLQYPKIFSLGYASHEGPTDEFSRNAHFSITFYGSGWDEVTAEPTDQHTEPPNKSIVTRVTGVNPGYGATCTTLITAALTILNESDAMPDKGGVFTPGVAFAATTLVDVITSLGVKFEVMARSNVPPGLYKKSDSMLGRWLQNKL